MTIPSPQRWATLSPLLDELLDLDEHQRSARLAALGQQDEGLAAELQELLERGRRAGAQDFLTGSVPLAPEDAAAASLAGQRLGAYVLEEALGHGGGGSVWRARREDGRFEGAVAVKLLHLSLLGRAGAERFRREGHILARLTHPHIARLLDAGVTPGQQPYLVLELVQGERIDRYCDAAGLDTDARLALFDDVLAALLRRGELLAAQGRLDEAAAQGHEAAALLTTMLGPDMPSAHKADAARLQGLVHRAQSQASAARQNFEAAAGYYTLALGQEQPRTREVAAWALGGR